MFASSHRDSFSRLAVLSANLTRQSADMPGTVRAHRSARPRSTGLAGSGGTAVPSSRTGMKDGSRPRYSLAPAMSRLRLKISRKWSSKKNTQTYQSVMRSSSGAVASGWV